MRRAALIVAVLAAAGPALAQETPYQVRLTGVGDDALQELLQSSAGLFQLQGQPPPSVVGIRRRAEGDREQLQAVLRAEGYYDGGVSFSLDSEARPVRVTLTVTPGPRYRLGHIAVLAEEHQLLPGGPVDPASLGLTPGNPGRAAAVNEARGRLVTLLNSRGFAFAHLADQRAEIDRSAKTLDVTFVVATGPAARFGLVRLEGLSEVDENLVRGRIPWQVGDPYRPLLVEQARTAISALGAFNSVQVILADQAASDGTVPVTIRLEERKRRFIGAGVNYSTSEGVGGKVYWGHRNLFGGAEQLRLSLETARLGPHTVTGSNLDRTDEKATAELRKPDFLAPDQSLLVSAAALTEHPKAYDRDAVLGSVQVERKLERRLTVAGGVSGEQSRLRESSQSTAGLTLGLPLNATFDDTDSLLDPTSGYRLTAAFTPYYRLGDVSNGFALTRVGGSAYYDVSRDGWAVLAARWGMGLIANGARQAIPADKRFYAGGGGSVRGYAYQKAGPLDASGNPLGGKSLVEFGSELRFKVTDSIGLVPFLDGGTVYPGAVPDLSTPLFFGAGLGARYFTDFGPLRLDLGVPLERRSADAAWQLYLSLGQAF